MKKEYQKILMESAKLVGKIPRVNMSGATATASAYVSAYNDYSEACGLLGTIITSIEAIENTENTIRKYRNREDYDIEDLKYSVEWNVKNMNKAYKELVEYISEREERNWG